MIDKELTVVEEKSVMVAFSEDGGLDPVVEEAKKIVSDFEHDMSTAASRKKTASLANKIAKLKTRVDGMGKDLVSDWKSKAKIVDSSRKKMRDELDELKVVARKPLSDWEAEEEERKAVEAAKKLQEEIDTQHEMALLMDEKFNREAEEAAAELARVAAEEAEKAEAERLANEKRIAEEAAERARIKAEQAAKEAQEKAEREKQAAIDAAEKAKRDAIAAEERAKAQAELAEKQRIQAEELAKQDVIDAAERARKREVARKQAEEAEAKEAADAREANKVHVGKIRKAAKLELMKYTDEESAKKIVMAISRAEIPRVSIAY